MPTPKEELIERIDRARASGRAVAIDPPMSPEHIVDLEARFGTAVPPEIRRACPTCAGFSLDDIRVQFGGQEPFEFESAFPRGLPIAADGAGNFWVVDVASDGSWGPLFFVAHDPPVIVVQAADIASFIDQVFGAREGGEVAEPFVTEIGKRNPNVITHERALSSADAILRDFAQQLGPNFVITDLRDATPGNGFVWGLAGPNTEVRRAGNELLFATEQKKRGFLSRLLSR